MHCFRQKNSEKTEFFSFLIKKILLICYHFTLEQKTKNDSENTKFSKMHFRNL